MSAKLVKGLGYLGLTAKSKRNILAGSTFEPLFPKPQNTDPYFTNNGDVHDTVQYCIKIVNATLKDTQQIAPLLKKATVNDTCRAIFDFFYKHYEYQIDNPTVEQLRRPARAWKDRKTGVDCDCFSISVSSVLTNLGIPHYFRIVKMYGNDYYQHIYVVVPKDRSSNLNIRNNYYVIDPVLDKYDVEAPGITFKKDTQMTLKGMPIQFLNGVNTTRLGREYDALGEGLGDTDVNGLYGQFCKCTKQHLINTRNTIAANPAKVSKIYQVKGLLGAYDQLIGAWDNEAEREKVLDRLSDIEETFLRPHLQGLGDLIHGSDDELFGVIDADLEGLAGLDGKKKAVRLKIAKKSGKKVAPLQKKGTKGKFTKLKNANKILKTAAKKAGGKIKTTTKKVGASAKKVAKKVGKFIVKTNPVTITARAGFLVAMKTNFGKIASRAIWGVRSAEEARAAGVTESYRQKSIKAWEKIKDIFVRVLQGNESTIKKAILTGRGAKVVNKLAKKGKVNGLDQLEGVSLGAASAATVTAALAFLTPILQFMNKTFKKGNGKEETETGGETEPTSDDPNAVSPEVEEATVSVKNAPVIEAAYVNEVQNAPIQEDSETTAPVETTTERVSRTPAPNSGQAATINTEEENLNASPEAAPVNESTKPVVEETQTPTTTTPTATAPEKKGGSGGLIVLGIAAVAGIALAASNKKPKQPSPTPTNGVGKKPKTVKLK